MELALVLLVVVIALAFEYINGFHDAANAIATVVSTKVLTPRQAIALAAFFNLTGALNTIQAFLPAMRQQQGGTIVNINSIAGQNASVLSGASYVMSKFALAGLTQSINAEEAKYNIRACSIFPGDINSELLEKRPTPPPMDVRTKMLQPQDLADCILLVLNLPSRAVVEPAHE